MGGGARAGDRPAPRRQPAPRRANTARKVRRRFASSPAPARKRSRLVATSGNDASRRTAAELFDGIPGTGHRPYAAMQVRARRVRKRLLRHAAAATHVPTAGPYARSRPRPHCRASCTQAFRESCTVRSRSRARPWPDRENSVENGKASARSIEDGLTPGTATVRAGTDGAGETAQGTMEAAGETVRNAAHSASARIRNGLETARDEIEQELDATRGDRTTKRSPAKPSGDRPKMPSARSPATHWRMPAAPGGMPRKKSGITFVRNH